MISATVTLLLGIIGFSLVNLAIDRGVPQELSLARNLLSFAAGLAIAGLLVPTRRSIAGTLERFHYRRSFGKRRALSDLGKDLLHERDLGRLCTALLRQIEEGVELERANLYLMQAGALTPVRREPGKDDHRVAIAGRQGGRVHHLHAGVFQRGPDRLHAEQAPRRRAHGRVDGCVRGRQVGSTSDKLRRDVASDGARQGCGKGAGGGAGGAGHGGRSVGDITLEGLFVTERDGRARQGRPQSLRWPVGSGGSSRPAPAPVVSRSFLRTKICLS